MQEGWIAPSHCPFNSTTCLYVAAGVMIIRYFKDRLDKFNRKNRAADNTDQLTMALNVNVLLNVLLNLGSKTHNIGSSKSTHSFVQASVLLKLMIANNIQAARKIWLQHQISLARRNSYKRCWWVCSFLICRGKTVAIVLVADSWF